MKRRRVLEKLILTEISGVDKPCQEDARVSIMKRAPETPIERFTASHARLNYVMEKYNEHHDRLGRFASSAETVARTGRAAAGHVRTALHHATQMGRSFSAADFHSARGHFESLQESFASLRAHLAALPPHIQVLVTELKFAIDKVKSLFRKEPQMAKMDDDGRRQLDERLEKLAKALDEMTDNCPPAVSFETTVSEIRKRDNCTNQQAYAKARKENPDGFEAYQSK